MAINPVIAWGRLTFNYQIAEKPHTVSFFCREVISSGTSWDEAGTGAPTVQETVNDLARSLFRTFPDNSATTFGEVSLEALQPDNSYQFVNTFQVDLGVVIRGGSTTFVQPFNQATWVFRDEQSRIVKFALFGQGIYSAGSIRSLTGLGTTPGAYRDLANWFLSTAAFNIVSRSNNQYKTFKSASFDSNERLRKEYNFV